MPQQQKYSSRMGATLLNTPLVPVAAAPPVVESAGQRLMQSMLDLGLSVAALDPHAKGKGDRKKAKHAGIGQALAELAAALEEQQKARF